ncbi:MAG: hypothetical protein ACNA7M_02160 [Roseovarius sp.]
MIRACAISLLLCLCALPALAETVLVRSGEHDGFTRLALDFPQRIDWRVQPREDGVVITFPGENPAFDLSQTFDRLTQGRLAGIDAPIGSGKLDLTFGCACTTRAFWHSRSMLVIDILAVAPVERPPVDLTPDPATRGGYLALSQRLTARPETSAARLVASRMGTPEAVTQTSPSPAPPVQADMLLSVRRRLLEQIAESFNEGLVQPAPPRDGVGEPWLPIVSLATPAESGLPNKVANISDAPVAAALPLERGGNLRLQGGIGGASRSAMPSVSPGITSTACLPDSFLDVAAWGGQWPLSDQVGALYLRLSGEFDLINPEVALQLARLYIHFGFGFEARQVLMLAPADGPDFQVLLELAALVDAPEDVHAAPRLRADLACHGRGALWAVLAHAAIPEDQILDHQAILRAFAEVPVHLRQHLGPVLARKFLAAKHRETSDMILRGLGHDSPFGAVGENLAKAELAMARGDLDAVDRTLRKSLSRNDTEATEALVAMVDHRISQDQVLAYDTAQLAGALYQENRKTPLAQKLGRSYLLALAASQSYLEAFSEFDRVAPDLSHETAANTRQEMWRMLLAKAEDAEFLRHILNEPARRLEAMPADLSLKIAQRVLDLGFADAAHDILRAAKVADAGPKHRLLVAEIALAQGLPQHAEAAIIGLSSRAADELRARSRTLSGDHAGAARYFDGLDDQSAAQQAAWFAQDWNRLLASDDPSEQRLAHALSQDAPEKVNGILSYNLKLLDQSVETRAVLSELLARTEISDLP